MLVELAELHVRIVEPAFEKEIREGAQQILGAEAEVVAGVAAIEDGFHWDSGEGFRDAKLTVRRGQRTHAFLLGIRGHGRVTSFSWIAMYDQPAGVDIEDPVLDNTCAGI